jgi:hypothetical protein
VGAAAAFGLRLDGVAAHWPDRSDIPGIVELRSPTPEVSALHPLQMQLWLGLREMARMRGEIVHVPAELGEPILEAWRAAHRDGTSRLAQSHLAATSASMVGWLEHCMANGWRLMETSG